MRPKRLFWQVFPPLLFVAGIAVAATSWYAADSMRRFTLEQKTADLETAAGLAAAHLAGIDPADPSAFQAACRELGLRSDLRLTVVRPGGKVLCDSHEDPAGMENHADRPEVRSALTGGTGRAARFSATLGKPSIYVAVPLRRAAAVVGAVRASVPVASVDEALHTIRVHLLAAAAVVMLLGAAASYLVSRRIVRPIEELKEGADRFARGELEARLPAPPVVEMSALASSMNEMARELSARIATIQEQRGTLEAILEGMGEGVVAVDQAKRVLLLNRTAAGMLGAEAASARGRGLHEVARNLALQNFIPRALAAEGVAEEEITAGERGERLVRARGAALRDAGGRKIGALVVLIDVTQLHRLERVRRDFVANVSHELKTPLASIAGFVETLLDGALDDRATAERFLEIVRREAARLNAIVTDLLSLARLEQDAGEGGERSAAVEARLCAVLEEAVGATRDRAEKKQVRIELECPGDRAFPGYPLLLAQAVVNLIDNAVAYSEPGSRVLVRGTAAAESVTIQVRDWGIGIPREHLPRLFERFYRVDKSRSRNLGGTGLGLSIVKHVAQVHGGTVSVQSDPGKGSTFAISIPLAPPA